MTPEDLLNTLDDLIDDEFKVFKWYLLQPDILKGYQPIKVSKLRTAERRDTVDLMVITYKLDGALKVTKKVLEKINRKDLVQRLSDTSSGPEGPSGSLKLGACGSVMDSSAWTKLKPEVNRVDEVHTYSLQSEAGHYECSVSALRWVCKENVSFRYQFSSWEKHMRRPVCMDYMPAGPLMDITVTAGTIEEVHLPHWICIDQNSTISDMFAVLHVDSCGDVVEHVSEVTSSHVKLLQPSFSKIGAMIRKKLGIPIYCDVFIYKSNKEFLTLDVYLVPHYPALQKKVGKKLNTRGSIMIPKPGPDESLQMGHHFLITTDKAEANIQPTKRVLRYGLRRNWFEVFIRNADSDFTLKLESERNTVWTCTIHKGDYKNQSTDHEQASGQHFVDRHRTALINRVSDTGFILDKLMDKELISDENYDAVRALKTTRDQMRDILTFVTAAGTRGKDDLYKILKRMKTMRALISELEESG